MQVPQVIVFIFLATIEGMAQIIAPTNSHWNKFLRYLFALPV